MPIIMVKNNNNRTLPNATHPMQSNFTQSVPREGVIVGDGKTTLFNDLVTIENVILTSRNDVREMEDDDDNNEATLGTDFERHTSLK